jgi:hypothetical protein
MISPTSLPIRAAWRRDAMRKLAIVLAAVFSLLLLTVPLAMVVMA